MSRTTRYTPLLAPIVMTVATVGLTSCSFLKNISENVFEDFSKDVSNVINVNNADLESRMDSLIKSISASDTSISLLNNLESYRTKLLDFPLETVIVDNDTLDVTNIPTLTMDSATLAHNKLVRNNALKFFPASKPYLDIVFNSCNYYNSIFPIPPETVIALISQESGFNPYIVSSAPAFGIMQFMRSIAQSVGMHVYSREENPKLYDYEVKLSKINKEISFTKNLAFSNFKHNNFDEARKYKIKLDSLESNRKVLSHNFSVALKNTNCKKLHDDRLTPSIVIPKGVEHLASLAKYFKKKYHCTDDQAIDWATEAYNAGIGSISYFSFASETASYSRIINKREAVLYPY